MHVGCVPHVSNLSQTSLQPIFSLTPVVSLDSILFFAFILLSKVCLMVLVAIFISEFSLPGSLLT